MSANDWQQQSRIYDKALSMASTSERAAFLEVACAGNEDLRREVESLLGHYHESFLESLDNTIATTIEQDAKRLFTDRPRLLPGQLFASRYRIVNLLGRGGMGEVYRADDLKLRQPVALKLLPLDTSKDNDAIQRLAREVRLARTIAHPGVCRVYDLAETEGTHYLSMECIEGETLAALLRRGRRLPTHQAFSFARQLCVALAAAHDQGVLHRDLKPTNIMVDARGRIRIVDFGLAIPRDAAGVIERAGTPGYMAPEQLRGELVTERTDLFALARVLNEIFAGEPPRVVRGVIQSCLSDDPAQRPSSAVAVLAAIPGGDAHASTLTEGRAPAPDPIASASIRGTLAPPVAWTLFAAAVVMTLLVAWQAHHLSIAPPEVPQPPEVLVDRAREILHNVGHVEAALDSEFWFAPTQPVRFVYRQSPRYLIAQNPLRVVTETDPPRDMPGMASVTLNTEGDLVAYHRIPEHGPPVDFVTPNEIATELPGVFTTFRSARAELAWWVLVAVVLITAVVLARRNLRLGEGDRRDARLLSLFVVGAAFLIAVLRAHHVPVATEELIFFLTVAGLPLVWGASTWLTYIGFEPSVRRVWPRMLVAWRRLLSGHPSDPLVGREILVGVVAAAISAALLIAQFRLAHHHSDMLVAPALETLRSGRHLANILCYALLEGLQFSLGCLFLYSLVGAITRHASVAGAGLVIVIGAFSPAGGVGASALVLAVLPVLVLARVGFLAFAVMQVVERILTRVPLTLDWGHWYAESTIIVMAALVIAAAYGTRIALQSKAAIAAQSTHLAVR